MPDPAPRVRLRRPTIRRLVDRHRRPIATVLAGLAVALTLVTLRSDPPVGPAATIATPAAGPGEVTVPVTLGNAAIASVLAVGDVVDLISVADDGPAEVVAARARVVELAATGSALSSSATVLLVAVPESQALSLSAAVAGGVLSVVIRRAR